MGEELEPQLFLGLLGQPGDTLHFEFLDAGPGVLGQAECTFLRDGVGTQVQELQGQPLVLDEVANAFITDIVVGLVVIFVHKWSSVRVGH